MSAPKLSKKVLTANLLALAAADAAHDDEHRARFEEIIARIKARLDAAGEPEVIQRLYLDMDFSDARNIAKRHLRMRAEELEAAVSGLNTPYSRVVNTCPLGKDNRVVPSWMLATSEDLRLSYELMTPEQELRFIAGGAMVGYTATQIAQAKKALKPFDNARRAKAFAEAEARAAARSAEIDAQYTAQYKRRLAYEATNPPVPAYVMQEREWLRQRRAGNNFVGMEVVFNEEAIQPFDAAKIERSKEAEKSYLEDTAKRMIRELEKLTEHTFNRPWKTKAELHLALRAHFKACGYDEELDLRWLRLEAYTAA